MCLCQKMKKIFIHIYLFIVKRSELSDIKKIHTGTKKGNKTNIFLLFK